MSSEGWLELFSQTMIELDYTRDEDKRAKLIEQAKGYAQRHPALQGWPTNLEAFWNGEALGWTNKIEPEVRSAITQDLLHLNGRNLDLGGGSVCYVPQSTVIDISQEMLALNDAAHKVKGSVEDPLPFEAASYDSVTMVFLLSYVNKVEDLLKEVHRVLHVGGKAVIVQSINPVFSLHRSHYQNSYQLPELKILLQSIGFSVSSSTKQYGTKPCMYIEAEKTLKRPIHLH